MTAPAPVASADGDFAAVLPAARAAATAGRSIVIGWLSRGDGAPLELITTVGPAAHTRTAAIAPAAEMPAPPRISVAPEPASLLFPPGAWGLPVPGGCAADLDKLVWVPCPAVRDPGPQRPEPAAAPGLFETALIALMRQPFGWLVVAEPTDLLAAETAGLRTELDILRRHRERQADAVERAERCLAERGNFGDGGLWSVRVLAGAASPDDLDVLAPLLAGSAELGPHPYRLRSVTGAQNLDDALTSSRHDPGDGAQSPFFVTAGTIAALAGLPRQSVPGLNVTGADPDGREPAEGTHPAADAGSVREASPVVEAGSGPEAGPAEDESPAEGKSESPDRLARASLELAVALEPGPGPLPIPLAALGHGVLVTGSAGAAPARTVRNILIQLTALGLPWLVVDPAGSGYETVPAGRDGSPVTVINPSNPDALPSAGRPGLR